MQIIRRLPDVDEVKNVYCLSEEEKHQREKWLSEIKAIFDGNNKKKILIVGPCSADREDAVLEYVSRLARLAEIVKDVFLIVPRIYTGKPRTDGCGYKGLVHRPFIEKNSDDLYEGIIATRKLHIRVIKETDFFCADEMLYPDAFFYLEDILGYAAVGARSVENQQHRLIASGLDTPVGMKNPMCGDVIPMLNAIQAARFKQSFLINGYECIGQGNKYTHAILRGYIDESNKMHSNCHFDDICDLYDLYQKKNIGIPSVIIDCNHCNSRKRPNEQIRIAKEVFDLTKKYRFIDDFVKGIMIESYIEEGSQIWGENIFGKSVTDACLGWNKTERLVLELAEIL